MGLSLPLQIERAVLIAGPTASGKSALAIALAERLGGEIVNADSMQLYREMRLLTARPGVADEARIPHHLYGVLPGAAPASAGIWTRMALAAIADIAGRGRVPIIVGGTGLYFKALTEGLAEIPDIPEAIRATVRAEVAEIGPERAHGLLAALDPDLAAVLRPSDPQRISRGLEVVRATGKPLSVWQREGQVPPLAGHLAKIALMPDRDWLHARCDARFDWMMEGGALDEVRTLQTFALGPTLPVMKALGVPPLISHLEGNLSLEQAILRGKADTRAYAKRQVTWIRNQMIAWKMLNAKDSERYLAEILSFINV